MTVGELKKMLEEYNDDSKIIFLPSDDMYGEYIKGIKEGKGVASFSGKDYKALVLVSGGQCGSVCDEDELDL